MLPAGCCCCCCCCLHTIGGIAARSSARRCRCGSRPVYESDPDSPFPYRRDVFEEDQPLVPPVLLYWLLVALAVVATAVAAPFVYGGTGPGARERDPPMGCVHRRHDPAGLQLVASLLAVVSSPSSIRTRLRPAAHRPHHDLLVRRHGAGMLLMGGCWAVLMLSSR